MSPTKGLRFRKLDLHVHSPESKDFKGMATPGQIVAAALQKGLAGIAITDHQTAASVDKIKAAAVGKRRQRIGPILTGPLPETASEIVALGITEQ